MQWDEVFAELEAEFAAALREEDEAELAAMLHAEAATVTLADRIRGRKGHALQVRLRNGEIRSGKLQEANNVWLMLHDEHRRCLIPHAALSSAWPLAAAAPPLQGVSAKLTLGHALRALAAQSLSVYLLTDGGSVRGRIGRVGADFCDVHAKTGVLSVPWAAILSVERTGRAR